MNGVGGVWVTLWCMWCGWSVSYSVVYVASEGGQIVRCDHLWLDGKGWGWMKRAVECASVCYRVEGIVLWRVWVRVMMQFCISPTIVVSILFHIAQSSDSLYWYFSSNKRKYSTDTLPIIAVDLMCTQSKLSSNRTGWFASVFGSSLHRASFYHVSSSSHISFVAYLISCILIVTQ